MDILFISDNFPPETNAPATRLYEHARFWISQGHTVTVITTAPNFPEGKLFPGYSNSWYSREKIEGINVVRVKTYITANTGFFRRTLDYMSFMCASIVGSVFHRHPDVVVATSPQFFAAVSGWVVAILKRCPFVFELRDLWPASISAMGAVNSGLALNLMEKLELFLYRRAALIITVTNGLRRDLINRNIPASKIKLVRNGVNIEEFTTREYDRSLARDLHLEGKFVVGYIGTHGMAHALQSILEAAELLEDRDDISFLFVGGGAAKAELERIVEDRKLRNVKLLPRQPRNKIPSLYALCDVGLVTLRNIPLFEGALPSKMFECMASATPIVCAVPRGEATAIIEQENCGICIPPEQPQALSESLRYLADHKGQVENMGKAGELAAFKFSRRAQAEYMSKLISKVTNT